MVSGTSLLNVSKLVPYCFAIWSTEMSNMNKQGLSRDIPSNVALTVRKHCGFGCVVCGCAIYTYEHVDPTFEEATIHDPAKIVLLCGGCHDKVTRRWLSKETVKQHAMNPAALQAGFSFGPFDFGSNQPEVKIGQLHTKRMRNIIQIMGDTILAVDAPEEQGAPFRLSTVLHDQSGNEVIRILNNEWQTPTSNWDVVVKGPRIITRSASGDITLRLRHDAPNSLTVEKLNMHYRGAHISGDEGKNFTVKTQNGTHVEFIAATMEGFPFGMNIGPSGFTMGSGAGGKLTLNNFVIHRV